MDFTRAWNLYVMMIVHSITFVADVGFLLFIIRNGKRTVVFKFFMNLQIVLIIWVYSKMIKAVAPTLELRWIASMIQYMAVLGTTFIFPNFAFVFLKGRRMKNPWFYLMMVYPIVMYIMIVTNPIHYLFFSEFTLTYLKFGILFYIHSALSYIYMSFGFVLFLISAFKHKNENRMLAIVLTVAPAVPFIVNMFYVFDIWRPFFDATPIFYAVSNMVYGYAIFRYEFLSVPKVVVRKVMDEHKNGIVIENRQGEWVYINAIGERILGDGLIQIENKMVVEKTDNYQVEISDIQHGYRLINIIDVSEYQSLIQKLEKNNEELMSKNQSLLLEIERQRKRTIEKEKLKIARNIHDELGHYFTMMIHMMELKFSKEEVLNIAIEQKEKLERNILCNQVELHQFIEEIKHTNHMGIQVDVINHIEEKAFPLEIYEHLIMMIKESMTNAVKHGHATHMQITMKKEEESISVQIKDNGRAQTTFQPGFGLKGMKKRVWKMNGTIEFDNTPDGFQIRMRIPIEPKSV